jgi:hypothetical protein
MRDSQRRGLLTPGVLPTDELGYTLMTTGMARWMGDQSVQSVALNFAQVQWIVNFLEEEWATPLTVERRSDVVAAAVVHLGFWLTWLRLNEFFSLDWSDVTNLLIPRTTNHSKGFPRNVGVIEMNLLEETKTNRTKVADIVAYKTLGTGLNLGIWIERLEALWPDHNGQALTYDTQVSVSMALTSQGRGQPDPTSLLRQCGQQDQGQVLVDELLPPQQLVHYERPHRWKSMSMDGMKTSWQHNF